MVDNPSLYNDHIPCRLDFRTMRREVMRRWQLILVLLVWSPLAHSARAGVGDPQIRTDHPWYPGELACSTFERLFKTQVEVYQRVTGVRPVTEEQKALAA
jgi:hypothetical protein